METQTIINILKKITQFSSLIIFVLTLLSFFGRYPFLELTTHFRFQYLWLSTILLIFFCVFRTWKFGLLTLLCVVLNGIYIIPYYFSVNHQIENKSKHNLKMMTVNIEGRNKNYIGLIQSVESANPDVLILQEVTEDWWRQMQVFNEYYHYSKSGSGLAIFSRYPIEQTDFLTLDSSPHPALFSKINLDGIILSILTIHPPTPTRASSFVNRNEQFRQSAKIMKSVPEPKLLIGDFNTTMWSPYFGDLVRDSGLRDVRKGRGTFPSWISFLPMPFRIPIDHCLVSEDIEIENLELGYSTGSDHLPLVINLRIKDID